MKIQAASRLLANISWKKTEALLSTIGIDAEIVHVGPGSANYELYTATDEVLAIFTKKFGKPKTGRKGTINIYVWDQWNPDIGIVLNAPPDEGGTLEIYDL